MKTQAILVNKSKDEFTLESIELKPLLDNEVLVEMVASGICHTDVAGQEGVFDFLLGGFPMVFGHEGSGIVKEVGTSVTHVRPGDKVLLSFSYCGTCRACTSRHVAYCTTFHAANFGTKRADGSCRASNENGPVYVGFFGQSSFAKESIVASSSCIPVPGITDAELRQLAPLGCGLMTGAGSVLNTLKAEKGLTIAIFGVGGVGFGSIFGAKMAGLSTIIAIDIDDSRLALAKQLGATHSINGKTEPDVVAKIKEITGGWGVDYSVETTALERVQTQAMLCVGKLGKMAVVGTAGDKYIPVSTEVLIQMGLQVLGVAMGDAFTPEFIPMLAQEYREGRFPLDRLTKFYKPEEVNQATKDMLSGAVIKPIIVWR